MGDGSRGVLSIVVVRRCRPLPSLLPVPLSPVALSQSRTTTAVATARRRSCGWLAANLSIWLLIK
jgi:hypothetical protein